MVHKTSAFLALFLVSIGLFSQEHKALETDEVLSEAYLDKLDADIKALRQSYSGDHKGEFKDFYDDIESGLKAMVRSDLFLFDAKSLDYLNSVKDKIDAANPQYDLSKIKVVLSRNYWPNAFCVTEGTIAFHVGMVPYFQNEDQLVAIFCHEIAHYILRHSDVEREIYWTNVKSKEYKKEVKALKKEQYDSFNKLSDFLMDNTFSQREHDRFHEHQADSMGLMLFSATSYNTDEFQKSIDRLELMNMNYDTSKVGIFQTLKIDSVGNRDLGNIDIEDEDLLIEAELLASHPDVEDRSESIALIIRENQFGGNATSNSPEFEEFRITMAMEMCESYIEFGRYDKALLHALRMRQYFPDSDYLKCVAAWSMYKLYWGRKKHRIGEMTVPAFEYPDPDFRKLVSILHFQRLSKIKKSVYLWLAENYDPKIDDNRYVIAYARMALDMEKPEVVEELKQHYLSYKPKGIYAKKFPFTKN